MTTKVNEIFVFKGCEFKMSTNLLDDVCLKEKEINFYRVNTACWEVKDKRLYLIIRKHCLEHRAIGGKYDIDIKEVIVDWFTGAINLQLGNLLSYGHQGYTAIHESNLILNFEKGKLISHEFNSNKSNYEYADKIETFEEILENELLRIIQNNSLEENIQLFIEYFESKIKEKFCNYRDKKFEKVNEEYDSLFYISHLEQKDRDEILTNIMISLNIFTFFSPNRNRTSFNLNAFNNILDAYRGDDKISINNKAFSKLPIILKRLLQNKADSNSREYYDNSYDDNNWLADAAGTDDPETMNDVFWNLD